MLKVSNLTKHFDNERILHNLSFTVEKGNKIALVGFNGTGKSTLLKLLAGLDDDKKGTIQYHKNTTIAFLPQDPNFYNGYKVTKFLEDYTEQSGDEFIRKVEIMFAGFALPTEIKDKKIGMLSSGQKTKVFLTGILLKKADLLLLDEPTNNLDLPALIWLENYLQNTDSAFIVVSHDKKFLDNVSKKIFEIDWKTRELKITAGKYSDYLLQKEKEVKRNLLTVRLQKEELKRLRLLAQQKKDDARAGAKWMGHDNDKMLRGYKRNRAANSLKDAQVIYGRMGRMEIVEKIPERKGFHVDIPKFDTGAPKDIMITNLVCGYDDFRVGPINLSIPFGNRICIIGLNGSGKTTILKTITGVIPKIEGEVDIQEGVKIGNLMQEHDSLPRDLTPIQFLMEKNYQEKKVLNEHLLRFGFSEFQIGLKIKYLSPGSRARLLLAYFALEGVNTLILDEPTNHLDLEAGEALENALKEFHGTVITVTHDRFFVEKTAVDNLYMLQDGKLNKIDNFALYVTEMEKRSRKLLRLLNK